MSSYIKIGPIFGLEVKMVKPEIPKEKLDLVIKPFIANQELDLSIRYWEGAVKVSGKSEGNPIAGNGYVELTGYATQFTENK